MKEIILALGISGSGKTYWSKQWAEEDPEHRIRLNYDDIRCMLGKYWVPDKREQLVKDMFDYALAQAMYMGYDIVIDNMSNLNPKHQEEYKKLIKENNSSDDSESVNLYQLKYKLFDTPVEVCIERDSKRENPIGEKVIRQQWKRYRTYIIQNSIQNMLSNQVVQDSSLPHCIIVDMDATLCFNTQGREFWGNGVNEQLINDTPNMPIVNLVKQYANPNYGTNPYKFNNNVIIITGRDESCRTGTEAWLNKYEIPYSKLLMRPFGNYTKGEEMKQILYENEVKDKYFVDFVLEDSQKVVKMYRDLGLTVLQPNEGKF